ncbi:unnamed protein product [Phytomonas sp. Hart1]|nr:unnamed protein product [Phytomonas sp. Hart1]|eukprot:CCW70241.1 unnamed protein product [Phytomonas sp. isolate Hart1]
MYESLIPMTKRIVSLSLLCLIEIQMQDVQGSKYGTFWSNRSKNGKLFKNLTSTKPFTFSFSRLVKYIFRRSRRESKNALRERYAKFRQVWNQQCNAAEVLKRLRQDPSKSLMDHVFWIGHSTILLCLHTGTNILFDPIFSKRCSPFRLVGPARRCPPGTTLAHLPPIHIVALSHNHYDHLDTESVKAIYKQHPNVTFVVPRRMDTHLTSWGIPYASIITMDWQDEIRLKGVAIGCTPAQHYGRRGLWDGNRVLWCGWCIGWQPTNLADSSSPVTMEDGTVGFVRRSAAVRPSLQVIDWSSAKVFYYAGDTAFNTSLFDLIHAQYNHVDMAAIPIGAYKPRWFMSTHHIDPASAVKIFKILNVKKAFGVHWATFELADDTLDEPPKELKTALDLENVSKQDFVLIPIGGHLSF